MSNATLPTTDSGQSCGACGAPVRSYWNACPVCQAPLEVKPMSSMAAADPVAADPVSAAPPPPASRPTVPTADPYATQITPPATPAPPPPSWSAPAYPATPTYAPPTGSPSWSPPTTQYAAASASYAPAAERSPARRWTVIAAVLAVLLVGTAGFAIVTASSLSTRNHSLHQSQTMLATVQKQLGVANQGLSAAQNQVTTSEAVIANDASEISAYKACISDLTTGAAALRAQNESAFEAAEAQVQLDCVHVGLG